MRIQFNNKYSRSLTFLYNFIVLDWLWKNLELVIYGVLKPSEVDSIMLIVFCLIITFNHKELEQ
jgi:hypothetical protein